MKFNKPLSEAEQDELDLFLGRVKGGEVPSFSALDGFLAAIVCSPDIISPDEYLPILQRGETEADDLIFRNLEEANRFIELVSRHYNSVFKQIRDFGKMERGKRVFYWPAVYVDENREIIFADDWANGFLSGTSLRPEDWGRFFDLDLDEAADSFLFPIFVLASEHHPDPETRPFDKPLPNEARRELLVFAIVGIKKLHDEFEEERRRYSELRDVAAGRGSKIGRNEPCPCGSGKKYKKCCLRLDT